MRVAHVTAPTEIGGLERVVQALAIAQRAAGDEVSVTAIIASPPSALNEAFFAALRNAEVAVHPLVYPGRSYLQQRAAVAEIAARARVEIMHTHGYLADVVIGGVARRLGAAAVTTAHGFAGGSSRNRVYEWLQRRSFRLFDAVVAVSRPLAERITASGVRPEIVHLVPNAWSSTRTLSDRKSARRQLGISSNEFTIGWVGRLSWEKGADILLEALRRLEDLPLRVDILGDGIERAPLEQLTHERGLAQRVIFHGMVPDAEHLYSAFDVFVNSSRTEGTPISLLEAMSARTPIVAPRVGGIPDMLGPSDALLVTPNDPADLAGAVRNVFADRASALERAEAARLRLDRERQIPVWVHAYRDVYRSALERASARK